MLQHQLVDEQQLEEAINLLIEGCRLDKETHDQLYAALAAANENREMLNRKWTVLEGQSDEKLLSKLRGALKNLTEAITDMSLVRAVMLKRKHATTGVEHG